MWNHINWIHCFPYIYRECRRKNIFIIFVRWYWKALSSELMYWRECKNYLDNLDNESVSFERIRYYNTTEKRAKIDNFQILWNYKHALQNGGLNIWDHFCTRQNIWEEENYRVTLIRLNNQCGRIWLKDRTHGSRPFNLYTIMILGTSLQ